MRKRMISVMLVCVMLFAFFAVGASAATEAETAKNTLQSSMASFQRYSDRIVLEENQLKDSVVIYRNELSAAYALLAGDLQEASAYTTIRSSLVAKWQTMRLETVIGNVFETAFNKLYNDVYAAKSSYTAESWADVETAYALKTTAIVNFGTDAQCGECMTALKTAIANLVAATGDDPLAVAARNTLASEMPVFDGYSSRILLTSSQNKLYVITYRKMLTQAHSLIDGELQEASAYPAMRASLVSAWQNMRMVTGIGVVFEKDFNSAYMAVSVNADLYTAQSWQAVADAYSVKTQQMIDYGTDIQCANALTNLRAAIAALQFASTPDQSVIAARVALYKEINGKFKDYAERVILPENLSLASVTAYNNELASVKAALEGSLLTVDEYNAMRNSLVSKWTTMRADAQIALAFEQQADALYNKYAVNSSSYTDASWAAVVSAYSKKTERVINYGTDAQCKSILNAIQAAIDALETKGTIDPGALEAKAALETSMPSFRGYSDRVVLESSATNPAVVAYRAELANAEALISNTTIQTAEAYTNMRSSLVSKWVAMRTALNMSTAFGTKMDSLYSSVSANSALYTSESWAAVAAAYAGKTSQIINYGTDAQCAAAISALETAIANLELLSERVSSIAIKYAPTKISYEIGETLDLTGAKITVTYADGSTADIDVTSAMVSGFDSTAAGTKTITVTYEAQTATFEIAVNAPAVLTDVTFVVNGGNDTSAAKGSSVSLPISVLAGSNLSNCLLEITYDTSAMTFNGATGSGFFEANETTPGRILVGYISSANLTAETILFNLNFTVNAATTAEMTSIIIDSNEVLSSDDSALTFDVTNITIKIS